MEWADILMKEKCGQPREKETHRITVKLGDRYHCYDGSNYEGVKTVTPDNKDWFEDAMNDPMNDILWFERVVD